MRERNHNKELDGYKGDSLNEHFRNGGDLQEDREGTGRDLLSDMSLAKSRPDVLANDLRDMGVVWDGQEEDDYE